VTWSAGTTSERVLGAVRLADDVIEVQVDRAWGDSAGDEPDRVLVVPSGVVMRLPRSMPVDEFRASVAALGARERPWGRDDPYELLRLPLRVPEDYNYFWQLLGTEAVRGPLGLFPEAYYIDEVFNAGLSWRHWLVPGVGFVRRDFAGGGGYGCHADVDELVEYHIPRWVEVP
jgi:hypothetical protein